MLAEFGTAKRAIKPCGTIARTGDYIMATDKNITVEIGQRGGTKLAVTIPATPVGKKSYTELIYMAIDKLGTFYTNPTTKVVSPNKTLHTTFSGLNGVIAKHYGFLDKNQVYAVYKHLTATGAISSRPVFKGMLIGMPGAIKTTEDGETVTNKAMSAMGL